MKKIINLLAVISFSLIFTSCAPAYKDWHYSAAKIGAKSIYINKDGSVSAAGRVGNKTLIKHFDSKGNEIGAVEEINLNIDPNSLLSNPYKNPNSLKNQVFISDQREGFQKFDSSKYLKSFDK